MGKFQVDMKEGRWSLMEISRPKELLVSAEIWTHHLPTHASELLTTVGPSQLASTQMGL